MHGHSAWELAEGDEIVPGRWALRLLGGGTRYEAYVAWDERLRALVAVKILRPALVDDPGALAGLAGEADLLERLRHPAIVRVFDAVLAGPRPHLVLEFLDGPRLSTLLRRYGLAPEQVLPLALELCSALHYLAGEGIVHLDVKPRNIIMSAVPRLIDLSVARPFDEARQLRSPVGTDAYMAPEQCDPHRFGEIGPATDMWGLGVTLHETIAKTLPFPKPQPEAAGLGERYPQTRLQPSPLPSDVPPALAEPLFACLSSNPVDRLTPAALADALEPLVARLPRPRLGLFRPGSHARPRLARTG